MSRFGVEKKLVRAITTVLCSHREGLGWEVGLTHFKMKIFPVIYGRERERGVLSEFVGSFTWTLQIALIECAFIEPPRATPSVPVCFSGVQVLFPFMQKRRRGWR